MNTLSYGAPAMSLGWLALLGKTSVGRPGLLAGGAAVIVLANLAMQFTPRGKREKSQ